MTRREVYYTTMKNAAGLLQLATGSFTQSTNTISVIYVVSCPHYIYIYIYNPKSEFRASNEVNWLNNDVI